MTKKYKINEVFISHQGEGARAGSVNVFIRFAVCDLACTFCDTEFESYTEMTANEIAEQVAKLMPEPRAVILSGGEPCLQYDGELYESLKAAKIETIAIETNGGTKPKAPLSWISCSPKVAEHVVAANFPDGVSELRYVRHPGQGIPRPIVKSDYYYLSPEFKGNVMTQESFDYCMKLSRENPQWRFSMQLHKLWRVR